MSLHLIIGGSGSGKSAFAEEWICGQGTGKRLYVATMYPADEESKERIRRHRQMRRSRQFCTLECYTGLDTLQIPEDGLVLVECLSNLTANELYRKGGAGVHTVEAVTAGVMYVARRARCTAVVTNDVFGESGNCAEETWHYMQVLGEINQRLAKEADQVTEVVYGLPVSWKESQPGQICKE